MPRSLDQIITPWLVLALLGMVVSMNFSRAHLHAAQWGDCQIDLEQYCRRVSPSMNDTVNKLRCLQEHHEQLSAACRDLISLPTLLRP